MESRPFIYYLPIATTILTIVFARIIYRRYVQRGRSDNHLLWWTIGVLTFGMGTFAEAYITLLGWNPVIFKFWYVAGALLGGAPLATGTVWLLLKLQTARRLTVAMVAAVTISAVFVILSPINSAAVESHLPSGRAFGWQWVRAFSPFINTYAVIFLIGGALLSAWRYYEAARASEGFMAGLGLPEALAVPSTGRPGTPRAREPVRRELIHRRGGYPPGHRRRLQSGRPHRNPLHPGADRDYPDRAGLLVQHPQAAGR